MYSQSSGSGGEPSVLYTYAMALTILFTVFVFAFEHALDERQAAAYLITKFPEQLEETVSKIDAERKTNDNKEKEDDKQNRVDEEKKDSDRNGDDGSEKKFDKDKPLLPQLKEKFVETQSYGTDKINFVMISAIYELAKTCIFLLGGYYPYVWDMSVKAGGKHFGWNESENEINISFIFLLITTIVETITSLPFDLVRIFKRKSGHKIRSCMSNVYSSRSQSLALLQCLVFHSIRHFGWRRSTGSTNSHQDFSSLTKSKCSSSRASLAVLSLLHS